MAEAVDYASHDPDTLILLVSRNMEGCVHLIDYASRILRHQGFSLRGESKTDLRFSNGSRIKALAATRSTGRGFDAKHVYLDEHAFQPWEDSIYEAVAPTVSRGGRITSVSTPYGRRNLFYRIWAGLEGEGWSRHFIPYRACPVYDQAWVEATRPRYTAQQWAQEFDADFVESGLVRFRAGDVMAAHEGASGLQPPVEGHTYINAWDIGRRQDATVGITVDVTEEPVQVVAYDRYLMVPYPRLQGLVEARHNWYGGRTIVDSTGVGDPFIENLKIGAEGFQFTAKSKVQALDALNVLLEQKRLKFPFIRQLEEELLGYEDRDAGLVTDSVMALCIAAYDVARTQEVNLRWLS